MASRDRRWLAPNHRFDLRASLDAGVRGLMLDVHYRWDAGRNLGVYTCHGYCAAGSRPLRAELEEIRAFLELHPREVVVVLLESRVASADVIDHFRQAGLE